MGITVRDTSPTPAPTPTPRPLARVESGSRLTHTLLDSTALKASPDEPTPTRRARPRGVQGAEVWLALAPANAPAPPLDALGGTGVPPVSGASPNYRFLSLSSRGNLHTGFTSADAGKTAYYALRWVSTRGEKGPWSEVCAATVAA